MVALETIDAELAKRLRERLWFTVQKHLVDHKVKNTFITDAKAKAAVEAVIACLDGLDIRLRTTDRPHLHSNVGHDLSPEEIDVGVRAGRCWKLGNQIPVMNARPAVVKIPIEEPHV